MPDDRAAFLRKLVQPLRVEPGRKVRLPRDFDPDYHADFVKKEEATDTLRRGVELLADYQARLAAQDTYGLLVIIQAMDAAGKDGTIKHVMSGVNPQGVEVTSFKVPSPEEQDHDYLWRAAKRLPARGMIGIFNRSYYEEVLVVRVHPSILEGQKLPPSAKRKGVWERRFREINDWERYLTDNGIRIVKLFLNVSKEEQRRRFLARIEEPEKNWKFSAADARERRFWDDYQRAFEDVLGRTSTPWAPWHVIPADRKWFMRIAAGAVILDALMAIDPKYPVVGAAAQADMAAAKAELLAEGPLEAESATEAAAVPVAAPAPPAAPETPAQATPAAGAPAARRRRPAAASSGATPTARAVRRSPARAADAASEPAPATPAKAADAAPEAAPTEAPAAKRSTDGSRNDRKGRKQT